MYYFDVLGGSVALLIVVRVGWVAIGRSPVWDTTTVVVGCIFATALLALITSRSRAYTQALPWIAGMFSAAAIVALAVLFWPVPVFWFAVAMGFGCAALVSGLVARRRLWSAGLSRAEIFRMTAIAIGVVVALALIETGLRLAPGIFGPEIKQQLTADPGQYGVAHPTIGYLHRPNGSTTISGRDFTVVHKVDAAGFRNRWPWPDPAAVVVVGDSVPFGYGVESEQAWPAIVAGTLPRSSLVNLSLIGAGPQQYLRVYETFGVKLHPKLLLVGVLAANDFWDAQMFDRWLKSGLGGNYMVWRDFGQPGPVKLHVSDPAGSLTNLFNVFVYPVLRMSYIYNLLRALRGGVDGDVAEPPKVLVLGGGQRVQLVVYRNRSAMSTRADHAFQLALDAFVRLHAVATAQGTNVLMVLQPSKEEVYLPLVGPDVPDFSRDLRAAFAERGIDFLDLAPAFRERAAAGESLFFEVDGHPNPRGYALIAQLVLAHLRDNSRKVGLGDVF